MREIITITFMLLLSACSSNKDGLSDKIEKIPVDVHNISRHTSSFIEKIEIVPLETNDSSLVNGYRKVMYDKDLDVYAIFDKDQIVHTFGEDGTFIACSKKVKGNGPKEYSMAVDMKFNPYLKGIDLLNPYGEISTYDLSFNFMSKKKIDPEFFFDALMPLDVDNYVFTTPSIWTNQEITFVNFKTKHQSIAKYSGMISAMNTMDKECFYQRGSKSYFIPKGVDYYFYEIDKEGKTLIPIIYLDFGNSEIDEKGLPEYATGDRDKAEKNKVDHRKDNLTKGMQARSQYLRKSDFVIPLIKFFNDDFIYIYFTKGSEEFGGHYIYNRKKRKGFLLNAGKPFVMQPCFGIVDNVLMAICDACYVPKLVDTNLMSLSEVKEMELLKEEDNPVILKYYLHK
ncbi:MAG: 6-bladed beta-propeller [Bacteroides sp.]|nr:6-bladed beta-propeller [Bacteroides sp.]MCI1682555.1 6-bladed beta-propeller [Bacteroides sp.]